MSTNKLEKLKNILTLLDSSVSKDEFLTAFKGLIDFVKKIEQRNELELQVIKETLQSVARGITSDAKSDLDEMKKQVTDFISAPLKKLEDDYLKHYKKIGQEIKEIEQRVLLTVLNEKEDVLTKIPQTLLGEDFRNGLEALQGEDRLKVTAIAGIDELEKKIDERIKKIGQSRAVSGPNANAVSAHHFTQDGTKTYYVPRHRIALALLRTEAPFMVTLNNGFTTANRTLTIADSVTDTTSQESVFLYVK